MDYLVKDSHQEAENGMVQESVVEPVKNNKKKEKCGQIVISIAKDTANFSLLKDNLNFFLITMSNFFIFFVYFIPFICKY
jgi:hypothetical protein